MRPGAGAVQEATVAMAITRVSSQERERARKKKVDVEPRESKCAKAERWEKVKGQREARVTEWRV